MNTRERSKAIVDGILSTVEKCGRVYGPIGNRSLELHAIIDKDTNAISPMEVMVSFVEGELKKESIK